MIVRSCSCFFLGFCWSLLRFSGFFLRFFGQHLGVYDYYDLPRHMDYLYEEAKVKPAILGGLLFDRS